VAVPVTEKNYFSSSSLSGRDGIVGIANCDKLDILEIKSWWGQGESQNRKILYSDTFPTRCNVTHFYLYLETALHVSGGTSTHHQERVQPYLQHLVFVTSLLLPAAIVEETQLQIFHYSGR
jgi:hypothetical protein